MSKTRSISIAALAALLASCAGGGGNGAAGAKSMEQLYAAEGRPVRVRQIATQDFSVYLKFPAVLRASSQSTAYALLSDVVRSIPVKVGDRVDRDQVVLAFSKENTAYMQAKASYENAKSVFDRSSALFSEAGISQQDFDNVKTQYEMARTAFRAASDMVEVKAPITGVVTRINVRTTENVRPGDPLFTVSSQGGFEARFYVTADEIELIRMGERARIEERGGTVEGSVVEVSLIMDPDKKAFPVTANFPGGVRWLTSGMSVDVAVEAYRNERAIVAARSELVRAGDAYQAFVAADGVAAARKIVVGRERGLEYEISAGLKVGDLLISEGAQDLTDGAKIKVVETLAAR